MGRRNKKGDKVDGWINLDKPVGVTSTQAVGKVRRALNAQKVGHAGTLDPLASGILPIALGEATKTIPYVQDAFKAYEFTVTWGQQRSTDDAEGDVIACSDIRPTIEQIEAALPAFIGEIEQIPPQFSAIKIDGQRAYDLARAGEQVDIKPRQVFVEHLEIIHPHPTPPPRGGGNEADAQHLAAVGGGGVSQTSFIMTCSKGTYVRSLARDLAVTLGTYGYVSALRRTAVGTFTAADAISLEKLTQMDHSAARSEALLAVQAPLDDIPALAISDQEGATLRNGQVLSFISRADFHRLDGIKGEALALCRDKAVALVEIEGPHIKPVRVFNL
ncbi:MAG: tRNA pseudouridine(55) synthase TruB [Bdellovibrionales bacterium]